MENTPSDIERVNWLEAGGMARLIVRKLGLSCHNESYEYRVRLNNGSAEDPWRYSEPFADLRKTCDFGIANPLR